MAEMGYCPSGRLFEAAACGVPILSDAWEGLEDFFEPSEEIMITHSTEEAVGALELSEERLRGVARAARERVLEQHTSERRAVELEQAVESARSGAASR
jgi:spore maturation protein CgeB